MLLWLVQRYGFFLVLPFLRRVGRNHPITRIRADARRDRCDRRGGGVRTRPNVMASRRSGPIDGGLPEFAWPPFDLALWLDLMPASAMIALVAYVQSFSIGTQLAQRKRQRLNPNQELIALGAADFGAAFTGGMPVAGSLSRSTGGGRTPLTGVVLRAVRARHGVVADAVSRRGCRTRRSPRSSFCRCQSSSTSRRSTATGSSIATTASRTSSRWRAFCCSASSAGLLIGILVAVALFVRRSSRPNIAIVGRVGDSAHFRSELRYRVATHPHVMAVRIDENLYFANASLVETRLLRLVSRNPKIRHLLLVCTSINFIDTSGLEMLERVDRALIRQRREAASVGGERTGDGPAERLRPAARTVRPHLLHYRRSDARLAKARVVRTLACAARTRSDIYKSGGTRREDHDVSRTLGKGFARKTRVDQCRDRRRRHVSAS